MKLLDDIRVGKIPGTGIDLYLNVSWWFFYVFVTIGIAFQEGPLAAVVTATTFAGIYTIVVMHELGHAAAAAYFGYKTDRITLYMVGGVATIPELEDAAETPFQEIVISIAGPIVNIFLAIVAFIVIGPALVISDIPEGTDPPWYLVMIAVLLGVNLLMAAYNLIPAFPLDGGRILRGILGLFFSFDKSSMMAGAVGFVTHIMLVVVGILIQQWFMVIISLFLMLVSFSVFLKYWAKETRPALLDKLSKKD